jgi:hypothetical protein
MRIPCQRGRMPWASTNTFRHLSPSGISGHGHYYPIPPPQPGAVQQQQPGWSFKWLFLVGVLLVILLAALAVKSPSQ